MALVSVPEASYELKVSQERIRQILRRGDLPHVRIGRRRLIRRQDLDAFIAARVSRGTASGQRNGQEG